MTELFKKWRPHSFHDCKVRNAKEHGAAGVVQITDALLADGFTEPQIAAIMGGNVIRVLKQTLP
jgi:microsomal dipeptidase-like Zn-dependent dipeptidase